MARHPFDLSEAELQDKLSPAQPRVRTGTALIPRGPSWWNTPSEPTREPYHEPAGRQSTTSYSRQRAKGTAATIVPPTRFGGVAHRVTPTTVKGASGAAVNPSHIRQDIYYHSEHKGFSLFGHKFGGWAIVFAFTAGIIFLYWLVTAQGNIGNRIQAAFKPITNVTQALFSSASLWQPGGGSIIGGGQAASDVYAAETGGIVPGRTLLSPDFTGAAAGPTTTAPGPGPGRGSVAAPPQAGRGVPADASVIVSGNATG